MKNNLFKIILLFFGVMFIFFGVIFFSLTSYNVNKGKESENWYETTGVIISSKLEIEERTHYDPETDNTEIYYTYTPKIEYNYTVNGVNYSGSKISFEIVSASDYQWAKNKVDSYYKGKNVTVYYNPKNPSEAVLEKGFSGYPLFPTVLCIVFIIIGFGFIVYVPVSIRKEKLSEKIKIEIKKTNYKPGEIIEGNVLLNFKKQRHGKSLKISFVGEKIVEQGHRDGYQKRSFIFCKNEIVLDVDRDYLNESYPFRLKIPDDALQKAKDFNWREYGFVLNKQVKMSNKTSSSLSKKTSKILEWMQEHGFVRFNEYTQWYIEVVLEIQRGFDIRLNRYLTVYE